MPDKETQPNKVSPHEEGIVNLGPPNIREVIHILSGYIKLRAKVLRESGIEIDPQEVSWLEGRVKSLQDLADIMGIDPETDAPLGNDDN